MKWLIVCSIMPGESPKSSLMVVADAMIWCLIALHFGQSQHCLLFLVVAFCFSWKRIKKVFLEPLSILRQLCQDPRRLCQYGNLLYQSSWLDLWLKLLLRIITRLAQRGGRDETLSCSYYFTTPTLPFHAWIQWSRTSLRRWRMQFSLVNASRKCCHVHNVSPSRQIGFHL